MTTTATRDDRVLLADAEFRVAWQRQQFVSPDAPEWAGLTADVDNARRRLVAAVRGERPPHKNERTIKVQVGAKGAKRKKVQWEEVTARLYGGCWAVHKTVNPQGGDVPWSVTVVAPGQQYDGYLLVKKRLRRNAIAIAEALAGFAGAVAAVADGTIQEHARALMAICDRYPD